MGDYFHVLATKVKTIPVVIMDIVIGLANGVKAQVSTSRGAVVLLVIIAVMVDIMLKGTLGVIGFSVTQAKMILIAATDVLERGGGALIAIVAIVFLLRK